VSVSNEVWGFSGYYACANGVRQVVMDLVKHVPSFLTIGKFGKVMLSYTGQPATCALCDTPGHNRSECPRRRRPRGWEAIPPVVSAGKGGADKVGQGKGGMVQLPAGQHKQARLAPAVTAAVTTPALGATPVPVGLSRSAGEPASAATAGTVQAHGSTHSPPLTHTATSAANTNAASVSPGAGTGGDVTISEHSSLWADEADEARQANFVRLVSPFEQGPPPDDGRKRPHSSSSADNVAKKSLVQTTQGTQESTSMSDDEY
jgi:hypothetical protein